MIAFYAMLVLTSWINWDNLIVKYNFYYLKSFQDFDIVFAVTLNNSTLPVVKKNWHKIPKEIQQKHIYPDYIIESSSSSSFPTMEEYLNKRISDFKRKKAKKSWLSWNYAEYEALKQL